MATPKWVSLDFQSKGEDPLSMHETVELYQEEYSDHDIPPRNNYSYFSDDELSYTERPIDKLCQEEDIDDDDDVSPRGNYSDFK